jgi:hypothetical protein
MRTHGAERHASFAPGRERPASGGRARRSSEVSPRLLLAEQAGDPLHEARDGLADRKATRIELQRARSIRGASGAASDFELGASVALGDPVPVADQSRSWLGLAHGGPPSLGPSPPVGASSAQSLSGRRIVTLQASACADAASAPSRCGPHPERSPRARLRRSHRKLLARAGSVKNEDRRPAGRPLGSRTRHQTTPSIKARSGRLGQIPAGTRVSRRGFGLQDEDLDRQVGVDVVLAHERDHLAPEGVLNRFNQLVAHHQLKVMP